MRARTRQFIPLRLDRLRVTTVEPELGFDVIHLAPEAVFLRLRWRGRKVDSLMSQLKEVATQRSLWFDEDIGIRSIRYELPPSPAP